MQEDEYTFVTIDGDENAFSDAVVVDVDGDTDLTDVVMIDESMNDTDFITLSDDTIMLAETDMDIYSSDIDDMDISFMV